MSTPSVTATQDRGTLVIQLARMQSDNKMLNEGLTERRAAVERLTKEVIQYEGALAYNVAIIESLNKQVVEVEAVSKVVEAPAAAPV